MSKYFQLFKHNLSWFALRVSAVPARHYVFASKLSMTDIDLSEGDML